MKEYYTAKDIQQIVGCGNTKSYDIIVKLQEKFKKEYPDTITIQAKIPIWYFEKIMLGIERSD